MNNTTKEKVSAIYQIKNTFNNKIYIGSSVDIRRRWDTHKSKLASKTHQNPHLINAWHKYGSDKFDFEIIEYIDNNADILKREQKWLDDLKPYNRNTGYNCAKIAGSNWLGRKHTPETKAKISKSHKGRKKGPVSEERRRHLKELNKGREFGKEFSLKMSEVRKGMKFSDEHCESIRKSKLGNSFRKGKTLNDEQRLKISGEKSTNSKLKEKDVIEIKKLLASNVHPKEIAPLFNISVSSIKNIKNGYSWKSVDIS